MTLPEFFQTVVHRLNEKHIPFALAGGLLASYYRHSPRATKDLDILIFVKNRPEKMAEEIIRSLHLEPHSLRQADLEGGPLFAIKRKSTPVCIVSGRAAKTEIGLDLLLPTLPWATEAIARAQDNKIDFGFSPVPCLTVEDLLLAKFYSLKNQSSRFMDLDDLKSIFEAVLDLELEYLDRRMRELALPIPEGIKPFVPKALRLLIKGAR